MVAGFLSSVQLLILKLASCHFLLVPVPTTHGDAYAVKWVCTR